MGIHEAIERSGAGGRPLNDRLPEQPEIASKGNAGSHQIKVRLRQSDVGHVPDERVRRASHNSRPEETKIVIRGGGAAPAAGPPIVEGVSAEELPHGSPNHHRSPSNRSLGVEGEVGEWGDCRTSPLAIQVTYLDRFLAEGDRIPQRCHKSGYASREQGVRIECSTDRSREGILRLFKRVEHGLAVKLHW